MAARGSFPGIRNGIAATSLALAVWLVSGVAPATPSVDDDSSSAAAAPEPAPEAASTPGRPTIELDQLEFPAGVPYGKYLKQHLRRALAREARSADWGAGAKARIEYRVIVTKLQLTHKDGVLRVDCTMLGRLPRAKTARSHLSYGGSPNHARALVAQVLEIVARGVVTRLAELERERRKRYQGS